MTLGEALRASAELLERKGVDSPRIDAELIFSHALGFSRVALYTEHNRRLTEAEAASARALVERRGRREPLAYILGEWGFRRLTLRTDARALVPRPETELVVERALALIERVEAPRVVDVGTGSGAIALAIASERPDARVVATDIAIGALELARENAERLELDVEFVQTDILDGIDAPFDLVVSNPPYVLRNETLPPELAYEPREALIDNAQTETLLADATRVLDGWIVVEIHEQRAELTTFTLAEMGYTEIAVTRDLVGKDRIVEARWTPLAALRRGRAVLLPTDTVYGLCARADDEAAVRALYKLKGRGEAQPTALLAANVDALLALVPELDERIVRALLPGAYTLVLPNPERRFRWLTGSRPETLGVRVPDLPREARDLVGAVGAVAATSANEPGEPPAASLDDVPERIRRACGAELNVGRLPGTASTVIDFTGPEPVVLREGAADGARAIALVR